MIHVVGVFVHSPVLLLLLPSATFRDVDELIAPARMEGLLFLLFLLDGHPYVVFPAQYENEGTPYINGIRAFAVSGISLVTCCKDEWIPRVSSYCLSARHSFPGLMVSCQGLVLAISFMISVPTYHIQTLVQSTSIFELSEYFETGYVGHPLQEKKSFVDLFGIP